MNENIFSAEELNWLQNHSEIQDNINESLEDSLNTNPLDSGEPDLIPYQRAVKAAHITIDAAEKKLITGPYNNVHWEIICKHLSDFPSLKNKEKPFWKVFSFECASSMEENDGFSKERIYMEAMKEMIRMIEEGSFEYLEIENSQVANLNSGTLQQLKGEGANAKFVD